MASTIQVDKIQDTGGNTIISSNSTGTFTSNLPAVAPNVSTATGTLPIANGGTGTTSYNPAGMTLVSTVAASTDSLVTFTGLSATYPVYLLTINNLYSSSDGDAIRIATSSDGGSSYNVQAYSAISTFNTDTSSFATTTGQPNAAGATAIGYYISNTAAETWNANLYLYNFATSTIASLLNVSSVAYTSQNKFEYGSQVMKWATGTNTAIQFSMATGTTTGTFKLYGLL
tara:strand:+ start:559 stop:1245 length:687 start_codon:yes stop_codon:yes gene_type:complete